MRHVDVLQLGVTEQLRAKLESSQWAYMFSLVDGPPFMSQVSSDVFTPVRRESKKERSFGTSSCHSFSCTFSDVQKKRNGKRRGERKWREMFRERVARIDVFCPFRLYEYI